jgi:hypothetical protein
VAHLLQVQPELLRAVSPRELRPGPGSPALQLVRRAAAEWRQALPALRLEPKVPVRRPEPDARRAAWRRARDVLRDAPAGRPEALARPVQRSAQARPGASVVRQAPQLAEPEVSVAAAGLQPEAAQQVAAARPQEVRAAQDAAAVELRRAGPLAAAVQGVPRGAAAARDARQAAQLRVARLSAAPWAAPSDRQAQPRAARPARRRTRRRHPQHG